MSYQMRAVLLAGFRYLQLPGDVVLISKVSSHLVGTHASLISQRFSNNSKNGEVFGSIFIPHQLSFSTSRNKSPGLQEIVAMNVDKEFLYLSLSLSLSLVCGIIAEKARSMIGQRGQQ